MYAQRGFLPHSVYRTWRFETVSDTPVHTAKSHIGQTFTYLGFLCRMDIIYVADIDCRYQTYRRHHIGHLLLEAVSK